MTLPTQAQIIVIGGGIIGCSTAYHLARDHKADVLLLEQGKITSGSTWHAAGLVGQLRSSASITKVLKYSVELYKGLAAETGLDTGWKMTGCLRLATTQDRWTEYKRLATTARSFGMDMELVSADEVKRMWPLMDTSDLIGASWLPTDGQASPSDITQSLAKGARMHGAKIVEGVTVTGFRMDGRRITHVETSQGDIACDKVVNCGGMWARQLGAMAGVAVPLHPVKHQYIITEKIDGLSPDAPTLRDPDRRTYFKEEVGGLVMGGYEPNPQGWVTGDIPPNWEFRLFDDDFDHFGQHLEQAIARVLGLQGLDNAVRHSLHAQPSLRLHNHLRLRIERATRLQKRGQSGARIGGLQQGPRAIVANALPQQIQIGLQPDRDRRARDHVTIGLRDECAAPRRDHRNRPRHQPREHFRFAGAKKRLSVAGENLRNRALRRADELLVTVEKRHLKQLRQLRADGGFPRAHHAHQNNGPQQPLCRTLARPRLIRWDLIRCSLHRRMFVSVRRHMAPRSGTCVGPHDA